MLKNIFTYLPLTLLLCSCSKPQPTTYNYRLFTFGTEVTTSIYTDDKDLADAGFEAIKTRFNTLNKQLHPWTPGELHSLNVACSKLKTIKISPFLQMMIKEGQHFHTMSEGLFDPAVGSLVKLWKFDNAANIHTSIPESSEIEKIQINRPSITQVKIKNDTATCINDLVRLDFGGFAKGYATEEAIGILEKMGMHDAIVNAGGDLTAIGSKGDTPWNIGIRNPFADGAIASIKTSVKTNIFTSGNYERFFEKDGKTFHHIIDPKTGYPSTETASVTVIHESGMLADAAATAIMIAGSNRWKEIAQKMGINKVMLVTSDKKIFITTQMDSLVTILDDELSKVIEDL